MARSRSSGMAEQLGHQLRRPVIQFLQVGIFQRVLILRAADAVLDRQVLHRLHVQRDAVDFLELRLQSLDHIGGVDASLVQRLQIDLNAPAIQRRVGSVDADERGNTLDGGILQDDCEPVAAVSATSPETKWTAPLRKFPG